MSTQNSSATRPSRLTEILQRPGRSTRSRILAIVGIALVPFVIAGVLVWALWNPSDRLSDVPAAIVNLDEPVTVNGQLVPLGRQLSAGLVGSPSDPEKTNYTWSITDAETAAHGLKDGSYLAVVTIPKDFSAAATSISGDAPRTATIDVATSNHSGLVDDAITTTIAQTAARLSGSQLTETYLDNLFVGFNTLGQQLGDAQTGAEKLADGADTLGEGVTALTDGVGKLGDGANTLNDGTTGLADGAATLADGAGSLASGAKTLADGTPQLATGARGVADGTTALRGGLEQFAAGLSDSSSQLNQAASGVGALSGVLSTSTAQAKAAAKGSTDLADSLADEAEKCDPATSGAELCATLTTLSTQARDLATASAGANAYYQAAEGATLAPTLGGLAAGISGLGTQVSDQLVAPASQLESGAAQVADGAAGVNTGAAALSSGAGELAAGANTLSSGASQLSTGADALASGIGELGDQLPALGDGTTQLADGARSLADGLGTAVEALPSYTTQERETLSSVVANPITTGGSDGVSSIGAGLGAIGGPFYAVLALWLGALASLLVLRAIPRGIVSSTRGSFALTLRAYLPIGVIGAAQGILVAALLQPLLDLDVGSWFGFAGVAALVGVTFTSVNQALNAVFGGAGKFVSMVVALVILATGIIATVPALLTSVAAALPVTPALTALRGVISGVGIGGGIAGLLLWAVIAVLATTLAIRTRRRRPVATTAVIAD